MFYCFDSAIPSSLPKYVMTILGLETHLVGFAVLIFYSNSNIQSMHTSDLNHVRCTYSKVLQRCCMGYGNDLSAGRRI